MGLSRGDLDPPLDDVAFLARSNHRVRVMEELGDAPQRRRDLREGTDISQPTLGRVLDGLCERGWARAEDRVYSLTPLGELVAEAFRGLMGTVAAVQTLRDLAPLLPLDDMGFDLRRLADGRVTVPTATDASAHLRRERELLEGARELRFLCNEADPDTVRAYRDRVVGDGQRMEVTIAKDTVDAAMGDPLIRDYLRDLLGTGRVSFYRYDGPVSVMLGLVDGTATITPIDNGVPCALIETEDELVRAWVESTLDDYRGRAEPIAADDLPA